MSSAIDMAADPTGLDVVLGYLLRYRYLFLALFVLAERIGLPLPAIPVLLAAGALAEQGRMDLGLVWAIAVGATLVSDLVWYGVGRRHGRRVLGLVCRLALEPDSCVRRSEETFERHGASSLLLAKFVPPLTAIAAPLAGMLRMRLRRFVAYDSVGALLWVAAFTGLGYLFADELELLLGRLGLVGGPLLAVAAAGLIAYLATKLVHRRRVLRELRLSRIAPDELQALIAAGRSPAIVDLRHDLERAADPFTIPGALALALGDLDGHRDRLADHGEVVLFCT